MKSPHFTRVLLALLLTSVLLNVWQFFRPRPAAEVKIIERMSATTVEPPSPPSPLQCEATNETVQQLADASKGKPHIAWKDQDVSTLTEDQLIFGVGTIHEIPQLDAPRRSVTADQLKALAKEEPSKAQKIRIRAALHLPGGRTVDLGESEASPGVQVKFQQVREFPFPTSIKIADPDPVKGTSFPVTPTTPGDFESRNLGVEIEVDVTPAPGTMVLGGQFTHRMLEGFGQMPGEVFSPIVTKAVSASGAPEDIILSENKVLQPQFSVSETPFLASVTADQPCRIPVRMAFGQTALELTCTPIQ